jgi:histidyl-tRNA synthetase
MLRRADSLGARVCLVLGDSEIESQQVQVKDLPSHTQEMCARADVVATVQRILASAPKRNEAAR